MNVRFFVIILMVIPFVSSCSKASMGGGLGAGFGAAACSQVGDGKGRIAAMVACGLVGGFAGAEVGHYLDELDKQKIQQSFGGKVNLEWTKNDGMVKVFEPEKVGRDPKGESCGEGTLTEVMPNGQRKKLKVSGCGNDIKAYSI